MNPTMSVLERPVWSVASLDAETAEFAGALGVSPLLAGLLRRRGLTTVEAARSFLAPTLADLADPASLPGMDDAVALVADAVRDGAAIAVHGDYDVDGITAAAILVRALRGLGAAPRWRLPHRLRDGYGLGVAAVEELAAAGARLLIAADCGITACESVARARALGMDVVVLDHHEAGPQRPAAVVVEPGPHRADAPCAAGLAFFFAWALRRHVGAHAGPPADLAGLAALGTVADVVPLTGDNRRLVAAGLEQLRADPPLGLRALLEEAAIAGRLDAWHIGWQVAPRLNAPGRLGDPAPSLQLLLTDDPEEARTLAQRLDAANRERQLILEQVLTDALAQVEAASPGAADVPKGLVVAGEGWHPGVVGLVAGRVAEAYGRPAVAIALSRETPGGGRGSARSVPGFDLVDALGQCAGHLTGYGGHAMAAGLSITAESIPAFRACFAARAAAALAARPPEAMKVDAQVTLADLTPGLVAELERLAPFGAGNPSPVLAVRGVRPVSRRLVGGGAHLGIGVTDGTTFADAIGFSMAGWLDVLMLTGAAVDVAFTPELDRGGSERVRLRLTSLDVPGVDMDAVLRDTGLVVDRLFRRAEDFLGEARYDGVEDAAAFYTKAAGVTFGDRPQVVAALRPGDRLRLRREPSNPHDPHAVRIVTADGGDVGYLNARLAGRVAPLMDAGVRYVASVAGVTGGGERPAGLNLFIEREPEFAAAGTREMAPAALGWRAGGPRDALARLPIHLNGGRPFRAGLSEALALLAGGQRVALMAPSGRGRATAIAGAAAVTAAGGRRALVLVPARSHAVHRAAQLASRLNPLGLSVEGAHGLLSLPARDRLDERLRRGAVDVVVASAELLREPGRLADFTPLVGTIVIDGGAEADWLPALPAVEAAGLFAVGTGTLCRSVVRARPETAIVQEQASRAPLAIVDRRGEEASIADIVIESVAKGEKTVAIVGPREAAVRVAADVRDRRGSGVAYLHGGLSPRLREIVTQAFREGRLEALVTTPGVDEEAFPVDVQHLVVAAVPPDLDRCVAALGAALSGHRPVAITLAAGPGDRDRYRRVLEEEAPPRDVLAAIYRALREWRGEQAFVWPDDATWAQLGAAVPGLARRTVDAACEIFVEAGVASRESVPAAAGAGLPAGRSISHVQLCPPAARRDLALSLRHREGRRARAAFEAAAAWLLAAAPSEIERSL
jgi:single-stranded-DNA-specific exonuclease